MNEDTVQPTSEQTGTGEPARFSDEQLRQIKEAIAESLRDSDAKPSENALPEVASDKPRESPKSDDQTDNGLTDREKVDIREIVKEEIKSHADASDDKADVFRKVLDEWFKSLPAESREDFARRVDEAIIANGGAPLG